jgi:hypothetical protein
MPFTELDRRRLRFRSLAERKNLISIEQSQVTHRDEPKPLPETVREQIERAAEAVKAARTSDKPVMLAFGAHAIKNGLGPLLIHLIEHGWFTHLATNGAGIIHDWEFAYQGASSESVRENVQRGRFGLWEETGLYLNLAQLIGAYRGLGYGESVGYLVHHDGLQIPTREELLEKACGAAEYPEAAGAAADLLRALRDTDISAGFLQVPHPYKRYGLQAAAFRLNTPYTGHPMFGHDIIYAHPLNCGAAIGRTAQRDFLAFAHNVSKLEGGVYLSVGSAVMSPMIFEKSLSMAQNLALQQGRRIENLSIYVVDLVECGWNWNRGEPPADDPSYYVRFLKTFSRMGVGMHYIQADNRDFLLSLCRMLTS